MDILTAAHTKGEKCCSRSGKQRLAELRAKKKKKEQGTNKYKATFYCAFETARVKLERPAFY